MANHRRGRPKNRRSGCLWCKPYKANGAKGGVAARTLQDLRSDREEAVAAGAAEFEYWDDPEYWAEDDGAPVYPAVMSFQSNQELARQGRTARCPARLHIHGTPAFLDADRSSLCKVCLGNLHVTPEVASAYMLAGIEAVQELLG